ncbi:uncharacterized protein [Montipora capricornis]|uniref:uncharacterized protein n=1 Tax=Montipora capricornis TaxID=246305 RepID=UPI0035F1FA3E
MLRVLVLGQTVGAGQASSPSMAIVKCRRNQRLAESKSIWKWYMEGNLGMLKDGNDILNVNRDDQAGFRLDTLATHRKHATPCISEGEPLTTKSNYVNKYPSSLQTTSYNFLSTGTTAEICDGIGKATPLHSKNPGQHFPDLIAIETYPDVQSAFFNCLTGERKTKNCVRVDGGHDEGPSHKEVQFWWTCYHLDKASQVLILTTRDSGSSNKKRIELQNGCLALAHSNLFIPSTLNGSCLDSQNGNVDEAKLKQNLSDAIDVYLSRLNKCPCADTVIDLYKGTDSAEKQKLRTIVKTFLKGKPSLKKKLKEDHPSDYQWIEDVWNLRARHLVPGLPDKYVFHLTCCYQNDCIHPLRKEGRPVVEPLWYHGGPPLSFTPLPVQDSNRPYGNPACNDCKGYCCGHYMMPEEYFGRHSDVTLRVSPPPTEVLKDMFGRRDPEEAAAEVFLPQNEVSM